MVEAEIRQMQEGRQPSKNGNGVENHVVNIDEPSDEVARLLLQKIRVLAREERFRLGQLR